MSCKNPLPYPAFRQGPKATRSDAHGHRSAGLSRSAFILSDLSSSERAEEGIGVLQTRRQAQGPSNPGRLRRLQAGFSARTKCCGPSAWRSFAGHLNTVRHFEIAGRRKEAASTDHRPA